MKRIWISIVLLILLVVTCALGASAAQTSTDHIVAAVESLKEKMLAGDEDDAYRDSVDLLTQWEKSHKVLCIYMPHSRLETVDETLSILPALCQVEDKAQFWAECDRAVMKVKQLTVTEEFSFENIF